jgi:hypothetical protein
MRNKYEIETNQIREEKEFETAAKEVALAEKLLDHADGHLPKPKFDIWELFQKAKQIIYIGLTVISIYMLFEIKQQLVINRDYEAATQNVTNRFIGQLEGAGQKQCSDKVLEYIQSIQKEKQLINKEY